MTTLPRLLAGRDLACLGRWPVRPDRPLHLDLGTGLGHFLADLAAANPDCDWIGLELDGPVARRAARRLTRAGLGNAWIVRGDARAFVAETLPPQSLDQLWINFPDPWPKDRHAARRHTFPWMLERLLSRLRPGGLLHLATDAGEYAAEFRAALANRPGVEAIDPGSATARERTWLRADLPVRTKYERKWMEIGRPLFYADWRVATPPEDPAPTPARPAPACRFPAGLPEAGTHVRDSRLARVFPVDTDGERRLLLIDPAPAVSTFVRVSSEGEIEIHGPWTDWKEALLQDLGAVIGGGAPAPANQPAPN